MSSNNTDNTNNELSDDESELNDSNDDDNSSTSDNKKPQHYKHHRHMNLSPKQRQIEWRRDRVHQLLITGLNSYEIADNLKISRPTIFRDIQEINDRAVTSLKHHITKRLPLEFQRCLENNILVLKEAWKVVSSCENSGDHRTKLQALALIEQSVSHRLDLLTNGHIVQESLEHVERMKNEVKQLNPQQEQQNQQQKEQNQQQEEE